MKDDIKIPLWEQIIYVIIFLVIIWGCRGVFIPKINTEDAVDAIVGEASNQSFDTMICVAQGIRHRGTLKGVYGFHARHNAFETSSTYMIAMDAWEESLWHTDMVHGAKSWGNREDMAIEQEAGHLAGKTLKARCGDLYFY